MMAQVLFQLGLASAFTTFVYLLVPRLAVGGVLFGVTVAEGFAATEAGRAIVRRYRLQVLLAGALGLAGVPATAAAGQVAWAGLGVLVVVALSTAAWVAARARTRPHAVAPSTVRVAGLAPTRGVPPVLDALPFVILGGAALVLALRWEDLPARFPMHWNGRGEIDRWAARGPEAYQPLVMGTALVAGMLALRALILAFTPSRAADPRAQALRSISRWALTGTATFIALLFGAVVLNPLLAPESPALVLGVAGVGLVALLAGLGLATVRLASLPSSGPGDGTPDDRWRAGGLFYVNPDDPALFVPKRFGVGYTVNLGRPGGVLALAAMIGIPLAIALVARLLGR
ncbi:MAG: DUF5808 domain-containing protein [Anaeromyxobacteraceae bacterium]